MCHSDFTMTIQEAKEEEWSRMWASASFVGVLIVLGVPLWWKTTEVYRVALPYDKISALQPLAHAVPAHLTVLAVDAVAAAGLAAAIQLAFQDTDVIKLKINSGVISEELRSMMESAGEERGAAEAVAALHEVSQHNHLHVVQWQHRLLRHPQRAAWLGAERVLLYRDNEVNSTVVEVLRRWVYATRTLEGARSETADAARRTRMPPAADYQLLLSVVNPRPDALSVHIDAGAAIEEYGGAFAEELAALHNFTLKSQWLHLMDFDFQPKEIRDESEWGRHWAVRAPRLPLLLTRLEERLATHAHAGAASTASSTTSNTVHLVLYAPPCHLSPMRIYDHNDQLVSSPVQAFMSPKWGGVVLGVPTAAECRQPSPAWTPPVTLVMGTFIAHLRTLLGIPETSEIPEAHLEPLQGVAPRRWELDTLLRVRCLEQLTSAERTLRSLADLLGKISNIVINDEVGASITSAVKHIEAASQLLERGGGAGDLERAYRVSQRAYHSAEAAFVEPSLLALLYFPDDQKYAIYIPLFLPIMFPVVLSLKHLFLWFRGKPIHKEKAD